MHLSRLLLPLGVRVSRLASGLPVGGDLGADAECDDNAANFRGKPTTSSHSMRSGGP
jgi:recombinational DNA repair protein RecR